MHRVELYERVILLSGDIDSLYREKAMTSTLLWLRFLLRVLCLVPTVSTLQTSRADWNRRQFASEYVTGKTKSTCRQSETRRYDLAKVNIANEVPRKQKREIRSTNGTNVQFSDRISRFDGRDESLFLPLKRPDLATQLQYARNGHAVIRQLLVPEPLQQLRVELVQYGMEQELAAWRQKVYVAADRDPQKAKALLESFCHTIEDCQKQIRTLLRTKNVALPFLQYFNTWRINSSILDLAKSLAETAAILMDVPSVRLYQDAIFWKRTGDGPTPWHTDARMAPFDTSHMITIWIPLQPVQQSGLIFCSKSHNDFALPYWNDVGSSERDFNSPWNHLEERYQSSSSSICCDYMPLQLGDVTVHSGWTLHCADAFVPIETKGTTGSKRDETGRMALAITYVDAFAPVRDPNTFLISNKSDNEDMWSYRDWVHEVQYNTSNWNHSLVPIVWPVKNKVTTVAKTSAKT